jgi:hypothetical protein
VPVTTVRPMWLMRNEAHIAEPTKAGDLLAQVAIGLGVRRPWCGLPGLTDQTSVGTVDVLYLQVGGAP